MTKRQDANVSNKPRTSPTSFTTQGEEEEDIVAFNANSMRNDWTLLTAQPAAAGIKEVQEALIALNDFTAFLFFLFGRSAACTLRE